MAFFIVNAVKTSNLTYPGFDLSIILKIIWKRCYVRMWVGFILINRVKYECKGNSLRERDIWVKVAEGKVHWCVCMNSDVPSAPIREWKCSTQLSVGLSTFRWTKSISVRYEVFTAVTMKNAVFWDIKTQFVPHRRHYFSATESSQLMLCTIWGFHGTDYKECCLLGCYAAWLL
jgi:hypothetical protein